jgi:hypothetical protein
MKKLIVMSALLLAGTVLFAQRGPRQPSPVTEVPAEKTTLSGTLALEQGRIVLKSGNNSYIVRGIQPLLGFVDGLKEDASVSLEGYVREFTFKSTRKDGDTVETTENIIRSIRVTKISLGSKSYDIPERPARFTNAPGGRNPSGTFGWDRMRGSAGGCFPRRR